MLQGKVDWRHYIVAVVLVFGLIGLLWKGTLGSTSALPTAPAPRGANPSYTAPDSP